MKRFMLALPWWAVTLGISWVLLGLLLGIGWQQRETLFPQQFPKVFHGLGYPVNCVALSPDGLLVAGGGGDYFHGRGQVCVWNVRTETLRYALPMHADPWALAFSPDGKTLATGTADPDGSIKLWDARTGHLLRVFSAGNALGWRHTQHGSWIMSLAFAPNGKTLAVSTQTNPGTLTLWDVSTGKCVWQRQDRNQDGTLLAFSPDGKQIASSTPTKMIPAPNVMVRGRPVYPTFVGAQAQILDSKTGAVVRTLTLGSGRLARGAAFSPDGHLLALIGQQDRPDLPMPAGGVLRVLSLPGEQMRWETATISSSYTAAAFSPDSRLLVTEGPQEAVTCWDARTGKQLRTLPHPSLTQWADAPDVLSFSVDGRRLAHRDGDAVQVWRVRALR